MDYGLEIPSYVVCHDVVYSMLLSYREGYMKPYQQMCTKYCIQIKSSGIARMSKLHGHSMGTFSAYVTHQLLGELGHTPTMKIFCKSYTLRSLLRLFLATNSILSVLPVCSLHVHMKVIVLANNWSLTLAFHIIFTGHK